MITVKHGKEAADQIDQELRDRIYKDAYDYALELSEDPVIALRIALRVLDIIEENPRAFSGELHRLPCN